MINYNPGIIICTRYKSQRLPGKALQRIGVKTTLEILIERLIPSGLPICLAYPENERDIFDSFIWENREKGIKVAPEIIGFEGSENNVLERFYRAAEILRFNPVIRITHDNILQFSDYIVNALNVYNGEKSDYLSIENGIPGTKFEIISFDVVEKAYEKYKYRNTEYLTYAFKEIAENREGYEMSNYRNVHPILAIDYPKDLQLLRIMYEQNVFDMDFGDLLNYIHNNPILMSINHRPSVSVYTCAYNAEKTIKQAMNSVIHQTFKDWEYIIVDDGSDDDTSRKIMEMADQCPKEIGKVRVIRNSENIGLAKSSNKAISNTRGKYILRLDADDELLLDALEIMIKKAKQNENAGIIYSNCWKVPIGKNFSMYKELFYDEKHENIGCALIKCDVWEEVRFRTDIEYCDGLDFYMRAKELFKIVEIDYPLWIYNQKADSMSHTGGEKREAIRKKILEGNRHIIHWSKGKTTA